MRDNSILSNIRLFRWKSVFFRYLASLFVIIIVVMLPFSFLMYKHTEYIYSRELSAKAAENAVKSRTIFDLLNANFAANYKVISNQSDVYELLESENIQNIPESTVRQIQGVLSSIKADDPSIEELILYSIKNDTCLTSSTQYQVGSACDISWLNAYRTTHLPFLMVPRKVRSERFNYIYTIRELYNEEGDPIGVLCSQNHYQNFEEVVQKSFGTEAKAIYIVSDIGLILYSSDASRINTSMYEYRDVYNAYLQAKDNTASTMEWGNDIISIARSGQSDLVLMEYTSLGPLEQGKSLLLICMILVLVVAVLCALFIAACHYHSVSRVLRAVQNANDPHQLQEHTRISSEFFYIINSVISSAQENEKINQTLVNKVNQLRHAQLCELQAQINPHFIMNTLQSINLSILRETHRDTPATCMISAFSKLMRTSYDSKHLVVSVQEEVENLKLFVQIQAIRYNGHLTAEYHIDPAAYDCCTLKLMLQPFVENCMIHGFADCSQDRRIYISCELHEKFLAFTISDNGVGMQPDCLSQIKKKLESANVQGDHIGIANVRQRLTLLFENQASIGIDSTPEKGTCVNIMHPAMKEHPLQNLNQKIL